MASPSKLLPLFKSGPSTSRGTAGDVSAGYGEQIVRAQQHKRVSSRRRRRRRAALDLQHKQHEQKKAHATGGGQSKNFGLAALGRIRTEAEALQEARRAAAHGPPGRGAAEGTQ